MSAVWELKAGNIWFRLTSVAKIHAGCKWSDMKAAFEKAEAEHSNAFGELHIQLDSTGRNFELIGVDIIVKDD